MSSSEFFFRVCPLLGSWIVFAFLFRLSPLRFGRVRSQPLRLPFFGLHLGSLSCPFPGFSRCLRRSSLSYFPGYFATFRRSYFPSFLLCLSLLPVAYLLSHRSRGECRGFPRLFRVCFHEPLAGVWVPPGYPSLLPCARKISIGACSHVHFLEVREYGEG